MEFNIFSNITTFDTGSEVTVVAPLLMIGGSLAYHSDRAGFIAEVFNKEKLTDEQAIKLFKIFYPAAQYPGVEKFNLERILSDIRKIKTIKNKTQQQLVLLEQSKKIIRTAKVDVERYFQNYMVQYGFNTLKPFVD